MGELHVRSSRLHFCPRVSFESNLQPYIRHVIVASTAFRYAWQVLEPQFELLNSSPALIILQRGLRHTAQLLLARSNIRTCYVY